MCVCFITVCGSAAVCFVTEKLKAESWCTVDAISAKRQLQRKIFIAEYLWISYLYFKYIFMSNFLLKQLLV